MQEVMTVEVEPGELDAPDLVEIGSSGETSPLRRDHLARDVTCRPETLPVRSSSGETGTSVHSVRAYKQIP